MENTHNKNKSWTPGQENNTTFYCTNFVHQNASDVPGLPANDPYEGIYQENK